MKITYIKRKRDQRKKRVAAYCRVSTMQLSQEESFETQVKSYTDYINSKEDWEFAGIYSDEKSAAKTHNRPGFQRMIRDAIDGQIDLILVKSISRFSRNIVDCQNYTHYLLGNGVDVYFEKEGIHTSSPSCSMIFSLMGIIAQDESRSISENVRWGYRERYRRGSFCLGNHRILGYDTIDRKLVPNQDAWMIRLVFQLFLQGKSYRQISQYLAKSGGGRLRSPRPMTSSSILKLLRNETYAGDKRLQKQAPTNFLTKLPDYTLSFESFYLSDSHSPIVLRDTWNEAQDILNRRQEEKKAGIFKNSGTHFLYGKVFCGICGSPYTRRTLRRYSRNPDTADYYKAWTCRDRLKGQKGNGCKNPTVREEDLLASIRETLGWEGNGAEAFDEAAFERMVERVTVTAEGIVLHSYQHHSGPCE